MENKEYILCAAVYYEDDGCVYPHQPKNIKTGFVIAGRRHHNCFTTVAILRDGKPYIGCTKTQGFITNTDRFVDRKEAYVIAKDAGQILNNLYDDSNPILMSEDVW